MIGDAQQRAEALDPGRSFIVEAPAGSGKTGLLVQRFLRLLGTVERPESVVAITFTRKAAAEMRQRVLDALEEASINALCEGEYRRTTRQLALAILAKNWNLSADPSRLQIQTIDSLCALLTRQMPVLSDFGGVGEVIEVATELYLKAAREMLTGLAEGSAEDRAILHRMVLHFDNDISQLESHVVTMLSKRDQWEHLHAEHDQQLIHDCMAMMKAAETQLRSVFQHAGKVDFTEIARAARRALGKPEEPSDLLYSLDYRLQHLLVDEFQDTSRSQFELIKALTEQWSLGDDHTLFLVGDPMQSIYRFREADVSLFLQCRDERRLGGVQLTPLKLDTNFRTTSAILNWVQDHFAPMMPIDNRESAAVQFRESFAGRGVQGASPRLVAHIKDDAGREEADEIVRIIQANPERTVAILVRSRPQTKHILPALRKAGIAYEAIEIELLNEQPHIIDVLSLTRAITNLADRVAWLACLRGPWCGLSLADLSALAEGKRDRTIFDLLSDRTIIETLSVEGRWRAVRLQEILARAVSNLGRMPLRDLVEKTWRDLGGVAIVTELNQSEDIETLLGLIETSAEGGIIRDFSLLNRRLETLFARPSVAGSKVSVMTVYQAKGLEFDTVILPRLEKTVKGNDNELLLWTESGDALDVAAIPQTGEDTLDYTRIKKSLQEKDDNETRRLFYVACTRAINELHLIGSASVKKNGELSTPRSGTFLRLIWEQVSPQFAAVPRGHAVAQSQNGAIVPRLLRRLPLDWRAPVSAPRIQIPLPLTHAVASQRNISYRWVGDTRRHTGTVVHDWMKRIAGEGIEKWNADRVRELRTSFETELLTMGVPPEEKKAAAEQVVKALSRTLASDRGRWILSPHAQSHSEWAIAGRLGQSLVSGTVDRAFLDGSDTYWIIDFKAGEHDSRDLDKFLANEKERYRQQLEQYAAVVSKLVNSPIRLGLYFPLHDAWLEWKAVETFSLATG